MRLFLRVVLLGALICAARLLVDLFRPPTRPLAPGQREAQINAALATGCVVSTDRHGRLRVKKRGRLRNAYRAFLAAPTTAPVETDPFDHLGRKRAALVERDEQDITLTPHRPVSLRPDRFAWGATAAVVSVVLVLAVRALTVMANPFVNDGKVRTYIRRTAAKIAANATVLGAGEIMVDEQGHLFAGDGTTPINSLSSFASKAFLAANYASLTYLASNTQVLAAKYGAIGDYNGRIGTPGTGTDNRAAIQAALNAASDIDTSAGYYNQIITRRSVTVKLAPGIYYVSAPSDGSANLIVPKGVRFDYSAATLVIQPPPVATLGWCGIQVNNYGHLAAGRMVADTWDGRTWPDAAIAYDGIRLVMTDGPSRVVGYGDAEVYNFGQGAMVRGVGAWLTYVKGMRAFQCAYMVVSSHLGDLPYTVPTGAPEDAAHRVATDIWIDDCDGVNLYNGGVIAGAGGLAADINALNTAKTYGGTLTVSNTNLENVNGYAVSAGGPFVVKLDGDHVEECGASDGSFNFDTCDAVSIRDLNWQWHNGKTVPTSASTSITLAMTQIFKLNATQVFKVDIMSLLNTASSTMKFANAAATVYSKVEGVAISRYQGDGVNPYNPPAGPMWTGGGPVRAGSIAGKLHTTSNYTISSTGAFAAVDTSLDLVLTASVGDWVEVSVSAITLDTTNPYDCYLQAATVVSGAVVTKIGNPNFTGTPGWYLPASQKAKAAGSVLYQLTAADLSNGTVTLRLLGKVSGSAGNVRVIQGIDPPLRFEARNLGGA